MRIRFRRIGDELNSKGRVRVAVEIVNKDGTVESFGATRAHTMCPPTCECCGCVACHKTDDWTGWRYGGKTSKSVPRMWCPDCPLPKPPAMATVPDEADLKRFGGK